MKFSLLTAAAIAQLASAHYFMESLVIDGKETKPFEFVRESTREPKYNPTQWKNPLDGMTPDVNDFRCNKGSFASAGRTGVAEVKAGTKIAFKLGVKATMRHPGPAAGFMSKAPGSVKEYEGDGDWFKVFQSGLCTKDDIKGPAWCTWDKDRIEFEIPSDIEDGEYLVRAEHVGVHGAHDGQAEFYFGCAQIKVTGGGNAVPKDTIKFPGYKKDDPAWNFSVWGGYKDYTFAAPAVYKPGSGGGAQSPAKPSPSASPAPSAAPSATPSAAPSAAPSQPQGSQPADDYDSQPAAQPAAQPSSAPQQPSGNGVAHNSSNCKGGKKHRRGSRAFRETLRK